MICFGRFLPNRGDSAWVEVPQRSSQPPDFVENSQKTAIVSLVSRPRLVLLSRTPSLGSCPGHAPPKAHPAPCHTSSYLPPLERKEFFCILSNQVRLSRCSVSWSKSPVAQIGPRPQFKLLDKRKRLHVRKRGHGASESLGARKG